MSKLDTAAVIRGRRGTYLIDPALGTYIEDPDEPWEIHSGSTWLKWVAPGPGWTYFTLAFTEDANDGSVIYGDYMFVIYRALTTPATYDNIDWWTWAWNFNQQAVYSYAAGATWYLQVSVDDGAPDKLLMAWSDDYMYESPARTPVPTRQRQLASAVRQRQRHR